MGKDRTYHYPLDAIRFVAALSVALFHLGFYSWASETSSTSRIFAHVDALPKLASVTWFGWIGVNVFFVISGFVIANSANGASPISFLKSRALRLYPAAWICATITLVAWLVIAHRPPSELMGPYFHAMALWPLPNWIDGVYWSLAVEVCFYATIFLLLVFHQFKHVTLYAWILTLLSGAYLGAISFGMLPESGWVWRHSDVLLLQHGPLFAIGIWMWKSSGRRNVILDYIGLGTAIGVALVGIGLRAESLQLVEAPAASGFSIEEPMIVWLAVLAFMFVFTRWPGTFRPRSSGTRALTRKLGQATYPLYLVHNVVGAGLMHVLIQAGMRPYVALAFALGAVIGLSWLIAWIVEPVIGAWLRKMLNKAEVQVLRLPGGRALARPGGIAD